MSYNDNVINSVNNINTPAVLISKVDELATLETKRISEMKKNLSDLMHH